MSIQFIFEFVIALAVVIFVHELGHFLACRICKAPVEEFGFGLPPRLFAFWRGKGRLTVGEHTIHIPANHKFPFDPRTFTGRSVDVIAVEGRKGLVLKSITLAAAEENQDPSIRQENCPAGIGDRRIQGNVREILPGTEFTMNWLPLGGFVKPKGETDFNVRDGLAAAHPLARIFVAVAGPLMNVLLAVVFYAISICTVGTPDPQRMDVVEIQSVMRNSPAEAAGLQTGDLILSMDGEPIHSTQLATDYIYAHVDRQVVFEIERGSELLLVTVTPLGSRIEQNLGPTGIILGVPVIPVSLPRATWMGVQATGFHIQAMFQLIGELVRGEAGNVQVDFMGPIGMGSVYVEQRQEGPTSGIFQLVNALAFFINITLSVALLNLLPAPALDGGRILLAGFELVVRRRLPAKAENWLIYISFSLLLALLLYVTMRDVIGLFQG